MAAVNGGGSIQMRGLGASDVAHVPASNTRIAFSGRRSLVMVEASQEAKKLAEEFAAITTDPQSFVSSKVNENATFLRTHDEAECIEERYGKHSWQATVVHIIHGRVVQMILSILLMIDIAVVMVELFMEAHFPSCHFVVRDAVNCCPGPAAAVMTYRRLMGGDHGGHHDICSAGYTQFEGTPPGCDEHKWGTVHVMHDVCFHITVCVLTTFLVELLILAYIERSHFLKKPLYVLDFFIVVGTLSLEFFQRSDAAHSFDSAKILILARCWRFVRIGHGLVTETHEHNAKEQEHLKEHCKGLVLKLQRLHAKLEHVQSMATPSGSSTNGTPLMRSLDSYESSPVSSPTGKCDARMPLVESDDKDGDAKK
mmetsp:Transcript_98021/g.274409  ORF Transcript_98021/g.274409 Transcript_98021/m.274409 type:complete len:368 (+) Transcript_98021:49-1152(+)